MTGAVALFPLRFPQSVVVKSEMGAGTEITVEIFHLMTLFPLGIEWTKIGFLQAHIFEFEIGENFIVGKMLKFCHDVGMFFTMSQKPVAVTHEVYTPVSVAGCSPDV